MTDLEYEILDAIEHNDGIAPTTLLSLFECRHTTYQSIQDAAIGLEKAGLIELDKWLIWRKL